MSTYFFSALYFKNLTQFLNLLSGLNSRKMQIFLEAGSSFENCERLSSVQLLSRVRLCDPMDCSMPGLPLLHQFLLDPAQTQVHQVSDAIQPSHLLASPSPPAFNLSQHQGLLKWVSSSHQVAKVLEFQLQHQSFQWTPRNDSCLSIIINEERHIE